VDHVRPVSPKREIETERERERETDRERDVAELWERRILPRKWSRGSVEGRAKGRRVG